jgi:hypothetical protein
MYNAQKHTHWQSPYLGKESKEDLYTENIKLKMSANQFEAENKLLKCRIRRFEAKL